MKSINIPLDDETHGRLKAAAASCKVTKTHVAREIIRATLGVRDPVRAVFEPLRANGSTKLGEALNRDRTPSEAEIKGRIIRPRGDHGGP